MNDVHVRQKITGQQIEIAHEGLKVKTIETKYSCRFCRKAFNHSKFLRFHLTKVHEGHRIKCDLCYESFTISKQKNLKHHLQTYEGIQGLIKCNFCEKSYPNAQFKLNQDGN